VVKERDDCAVCLFTDGFGGRGGLDMGRKGREDLVHVWTDI